MQGEDDSVNPKYVNNIGNGRITTSEVLGKTWKYSNDEELVDTIKQLIELGYAFVHQPAGWPPAAVLEDLQEKGLLDTEFTAITWSGNGFRTFTIQPR